jgi:hypothetical protein
MDENGLVLITIVTIFVWIGMLLCLGGLVFWWGTFKIPNNHVGLDPGKKVYSPGRHFHLSGRFLRLIVIDFPTLEKRVSGDIRATIKDQLAAIQTTAKEIGCSFEFDISTPVRRFVRANKEEILLAVADLEPLTRQITIMADSSLSNLRHSNETYKRALAEYESARNEVVGSGSGSLIRELDTAHDALISSNLKQLVSKNRGAEFDEIVKGAISHLQGLRSLAMQIQGEYEVGPGFTKSSDWLKKLEGVSE